MAALALIRSSEKMQECNTWQCINSFALWISSFGTVATLSVTIWLAVRDKWPRVKIYTGKLIIFPELTVPKGGQVEFETKDCPFYFEAWVTNVGPLPVPVESCIWVIRIGLRKHLAVGYNLSMNKKFEGCITFLPQTLEYGERATLIYEPFYLPSPQDSLHGTKSRFVAWLRCNSLKCEIKTTVGTRYRVKADRDIKSALWKAYKEKYLPEKG